ncbi:MAG: hypothetical protein K2W95_12385 [Candidatus Obscuribacterales bacterium]|nr:hypothetical protein [Candidatus Obscuribacterales bacterium]
MSGQTADEISVLELKSKMDAGEQVILLDVREPHELEICCLKNTFHFPMAELRFHMDDLEPYRNHELIVYCRTGRRSAMAAMFLRDAGFSGAKNLTGGVHAWSDQVDSSFQKY